MTNDDSSDDDSSNDDSSNDDSSDDDSSNDDSSDDDSSDVDSSNVDSSDVDSSDVDSSDVDTSNVDTSSDVDSSLNINLGYKEKTPIQQLIIKECQNEYISIEEIALKVNRSEKYLKNKIIPEMIKGGFLIKMYPQTNHPLQKYISK